MGGISHPCFGCHSPTCVSRVDDFDEWVPHGWNSAIGLAADLHLTAAVPVARHVEYLTPCVYLDELITEPFRPDAEGYLTIPDKPGLGIELNREAMKRLGY